MQIPGKEQKQISVGMDSGMHPEGENLSFDRTRMAAERTLMAWVRTALSMISFGFTIYKFLQAMQEQRRLLSVKSDTPRNLCLSLIGIGIFALMLTVMSHGKYL